MSVINYLDETDALLFEIFKDMGLHRRIEDDYEQRKKFEDNLIIEVHCKIIHTDQPVNESVKRILEHIFETEFCKEFGDDPQTKHICAQLIPRFIAGTMKILDKNIQKIRNFFNSNTFSEAEIMKYYFEQEDTEFDADLKGVLEYAFQVSYRSGELGTGEEALLVTTFGNRFESLFKAGFMSNLPAVLADFLAGVAFLRSECVPRPETAVDQLLCDKYAATHEEQVHYMTKIFLRLSSPILFDLEMECLIEELEPYIISDMMDIIKCENKALMAGERPWSLIDATEHHLVSRITESIHRWTYFVSERDGFEGYVSHKDLRYFKNRFVKLVVCIRYKAIKRTEQCMLAVNMNIPPNPMSPAEEEIFMGFMVANTESEITRLAVECATATAFRSVIDVGYGNVVNGALNEAFVAARLDPDYFDDERFFIEIEHVSRRMIRKCMRGMTESGLRSTVLESLKGFVWKGVANMMEEKSYSCVYGYIDKVGSLESEEDVYYASWGVICVLALVWVIAEQRCRHIHHAAVEYITEEFV